jgi:hypothetical protein
MYLQVGVETRHQATTDLFQTIPTYSLPFDDTASVVKYKHKLTYRNQTMLL